VISTVLPAYKYLIEERKLTEDTINAFNLGYCSTNGEIYEGANFQGMLPILDPRFYHSTLFPIADMHGTIVGVSARPLGPTQTKYINTSYEKSDHLYGLNVTWKDCLLKQSVYVVEGNISLLIPWQHGIKNIVAMLGKTFSFKQICLLSRFVKKIVFVPDGDLSGQKLLEKLQKTIPNQFYDADVEFTYLSLPDGKDPDDFIKVFGKDAFLKLEERKLVL
jgi:DNA primase